MDFLVWVELSDVIFDVLVFGGGDFDEDEDEEECECCWWCVNNGGGLIGEFVFNMEVIFFGGDILNFLIESLVIIEFVVVVDVSVVWFVCLVVGVEVGDWVNCGEFVFVDGGFVLIEG